MTDGERIAASARGWLGTRFHHQGRLKKTAQHKGGVDCLGLLVGVAAELELRGKNGKLLAALDEVDYSHQPDTQRLKEQLEAALFTASLFDLQMGDVVLMEIDGRAQHLAIISQTSAQTHMIHAYAPAHGVVEHVLDSTWLARIRAVFRAF